MSREQIVGTIATMQLSHYECSQMQNMENRPAGLGSSACPLIATTVLLDAVTNPQPLNDAYFKNAIEEGVTDWDARCRDASELLEGEDASTILSAELEKRGVEGYVVKSPEVCGEAGFVHMLNTSAGALVTGLRGEEGNRSSGKTFATMHVLEVLRTLDSHPHPAFSPNGACAAECQETDKVVQMASWIFRTDGGLLSSLGCDTTHVEVVALVRAEAASGSPALALAGADSAAEEDVPSAPIRRKSSRQVLLQKMKVLTERVAVLEAKEKKRAAAEKKRRASTPALRQPRQAYQLWMDGFRDTEEYAAIKAIQKSLQQTSKVCSAKWSVMTPEEKKPFTDAHTVAIAEYHREKRARQDMD